MSSDDSLAVRMAASANSVYISVGISEISEW